MFLSLPLTMMHFFFFKIFKFFIDSSFVFTFNPFKVNTFSASLCLLLNIFLTSEFNSSTMNKPQGLSLTC